jgi:transposase
MFIRRKKNSSGSISVQIINKSSGKYKVVKTIGSSKDDKQIEKFLIKAEEELLAIERQFRLNFQADKEKDLVNTFFNSIEEFTLLGPELLLGKIFDQVGFNKIKDELFRHLVIARIIYPASKLKTVDYLYKYKAISIDVDKVYRYLDKLHKQEMMQIQKISYNYIKEISQGELSIVFYDVTTLYFETEEEDDLRKLGFSKDGKEQNPQIVLGLLVNHCGFPLAYEIFEGNKFEGHTMLGIVESFKKRYYLEEIIIVVDAAMMSNKNIKELTANNYKYIVGARIKNESDKLKSQILSLNLKDGQSTSITKNNGERLIVSYSQQRAKKDQYNRKRGLNRLEKLLSGRKLTKKQINNKGYNKYLKLDGEINLSIDYDKYKEDEKWNGLKGYLTNTDLSKEEVIKQYKQLWHIERTFRISKTDLRIRPIFHYLKRRIESHVCIAFAACVVYKELERQLQEKRSNITAGKAIDILKTIYALTIITPYSKSKYTRLLIKNKEQDMLLKLFDISLGCPNA